jgi:hypothetical protein
MSIHGTNHPGTSGGHKKSPQYPGQDGHPQAFPETMPMPMKKTPDQAGKAHHPSPGGHPPCDKCP